MPLRIIPLPRGTSGYNRPIGPSRNPRTAAAAARRRGPAPTTVEIVGRAAEEGPMAGPNPMTRLQRLGRSKTLRYGGGAALAGLGGLGMFSLAERSGLQMRQEQALEDFKKTQRRMILDQMAEEAQRATLQDSIQRNLQAVQQNAPDLYMQVMTGRRLPQGAVVLGGEPRNDLLQELGRAMAEGQFTR